MLRGNFKRAARYRNIDNLHVIPISSVVNNNPVQLQPDPIMPKVFPSIVPVPILPVTSPVFSSANNYQGKFNKRRKRVRKRDRKNFANKTVLHNSSEYRWFNASNTFKNNVADIPMEKEDEKVEVMPEPEAPPPAEEHFEEVEVASTEGDGKRIPVGFRKTKLHYLSYKKKSFFKPKFYDFSSQRTVVNCLNVEDDVSVDVDVDVVSEAEYDGYETDPYDAVEKFGRIIEIEDEDETEEEETVHDVNNEMEEESTHIVTDETEESIPAVSDEVDEEHTPADANGMEKKSISAVANEIKEKSSNAVANEIKEKSSNAVANEINEKSSNAAANEINEKSSNAAANEINEKSSNAVASEINEKSSCTVANEINEKSSCAVADEIKEKSTDVSNEVKKEKLIERKEVTTSKKWINKASFEGNGDLIQTKSLIQDKLDVWESHLIGLEYLLEICDKNMVSVLKYYCVLCDEEFDVQELPESYVINHVSGCNHIAKYLEKHFPTCGFKLSENSNYDFVVFQKLCEKINENLGYYFLCITNNDYYSENKLKIKEIIENTSHPSEVDFKFEKCTFEKDIDSDLSKNINNIIENVIKKIIPEKEILTCEPNKKSEDNKSKLGGKLTDLEPKKKPAAPKPKHKGNNSVSAFLRLKFAATNKLKLSDKEKNKKTKSNIEDTVEIVKSHNEEVKENTKSQNEQEIKESSNKHVIKHIKPKNDQLMKSPISKSIIQKVQVKQERVIETITLDDEEDNIELKNEKLEEKESKDVAQNLENSTTDNSTPVKSQEVTTSKVVKNIAAKKVLKNNEKVLLKTTIHSKHCRKRILDKGIAGITRLRLAAAKTTTKGRLVTGVSNKLNVKCKSVTEKVSSDVPKKIIAKKIKPELKENKIAVTSNRKTKPSFNVIVPVQQTPAAVSKLPVTVHASLHQKSVQKKSTENSSKNEVGTVGNDSSHWIPMRSSSPVLNSDISLFLKKITSKPSEHPVKKRRISKSPTRKITSPLRLVSKTHSRRHSKSPRRKRDSKSPVRRKSRSPYRKSSKSPVRRSRSPIRKRSRSPQRRRSRSPVRRRSRSPRRRSRSLLRHRSRSPLRRQSRSPLRRQSRSPARRSRSPLARYSRSPLRRHSRSPLRRHSRSPVKRRSRSPYRRQSRSPGKRRSRSPYRRQSRSPVFHPLKLVPDVYPYIGLRQPRQSRSNLREVNTSFGQSSMSREYYSPDEHHHNIPKHSNLRESDIIRHREESRMLHSPKVNKSDRYKSQPLSSVSARGISDLDPVSDEDESIYFSDKHMLSEDTNISSTSKMVLSKLLQKFSMADNPSDPALNNFLQFMETHRAELEEFIALKSSPKPEKMKIDLQQQTLLLQQFLLANLASRIQESGPSVSNLPYIPPQPPFLTDNTSLRFGPPAMNMPTPATMPPVPSQPAPMQPRFFPPNVNVPPPQFFQHNVQQPMQDFSAKPKPTSEVVFKDLKATVSKLFGANEGGMKQVTKPQMSSFVTNQLPDPEKWDLNHPNAPKFNVPLGPKNAFPPSGKNVNYSGAHENPIMREQMPSRNNNAPGQFSSGSGNDRAQLSNVPVPPPDAKVTFCDSPRSSSKGNLFPVVNPNFNPPNTRGGVSDVKVSLAQRLASVLVKIGMVDVPAPLLQEMLMKIGAFSSSPRQDISENEILSILKRLGYLS